MSDKHFVLDVDPDGLRAVATQVADLARTFDRRGRHVSAAPDEIGPGWTGMAADLVKTEMRALGDHLDDFGRRLDDLPAALRALAADYQDALDRLPGMNRRWEEAEQAYQDAVAAADSALSRGRADARGDDGALDPSDAASLRRTRDGAVEDAAGARHRTQYWLEYEFHQTKIHLAQRTRELGELLRGSGPLRVDDATVAAWRAGQGPRIDTTPLLSDLELTRLREAQLVTPEVRRQVEVLQRALEDGDPAEVQEALDAIGAWADDPVMSQALVQVLGPDGIQDLYLRIDEGLKDSTYVFEEVWPHLQGFTDAVARGTSQLSDEAFADHLEAWMTTDHGPKMWALVASSEAADGRINAVATSYHSEVYNAALSDSLGMPGLFPQAFAYAYEDVDQLELWTDRSSGADLARVLQRLDPEVLEDLLFRMHNVQVPGGTMDEDDYAHVARLWGETVTALRDMAVEAHAAGNRVFDHGPLLTVLEARNSNGFPYGEHLARYVEETVRDSALMALLLTDLDSRDVDPGAVRRLIDDSGVDVEDVVAGVMAHQLAAGATAEQVAQNLGNLMRADDIIDEDFEWTGALTSLLESGVSAAAGTNPVTGALSGPTIGVFKAIVDELGDQADLDRDWDGDAGKARAQEILAFQLYLQHHGPPEGWDDFAAQQGPLTERPSSIVTGYIDDMPELDPQGWEELRLLITTIDDRRRAR